MRNEPVWLGLRLILDLQERQIVRFGGIDGVRDEGLLQSALGRPRNLFVYGDPDLFDLAAAYAFGLVRNHPFADGNKRIGFVAAALFLDQNGFDLLAPEAEAVVMTLGLASGELEEGAYALWLRDRSERR